MERLIVHFAAALALGLVCSAVCVGEEASDVGFEFLATYCIDCHHDGDSSADRNFEGLDHDSFDFDSLLLIQEAIDQLTLGAMPPADAGQPDRDERLRAIRSLSQYLSLHRERLSAGSGRTNMRRLNRREYRNTVADLFDLDLTLFDPTVNFPADGPIEHFDTVADDLVTSGFLLDQYLDGAEAIVDRLLRRSPHPESKRWVFGGPFLQQPELDAAHRYAFDRRYMALYDHPHNEKPEGAYGPLHGFEGVHSDGVYRVTVVCEARNRWHPYGEKAVRRDTTEPFRLGIRPGNSDTGDMAHTQPVEPLLASAELPDGERVTLSFEMPLDRGYAPRFTFENGLTDVRNTYARVVRMHGDQLPQAVATSKGIVAWRKGVLKHGELPHIRVFRIEVEGPLESSSQSATSAAFDFTKIEETESALRALGRLARRAFRGPLTPVQQKVIDSFFVERIDAGASVKEATAETLQLILCSPGFLYFHPMGELPQSASESANHRHAVAERLSYFLTSSMPNPDGMRWADRGGPVVTEDLREFVRDWSTSEQCATMVADFLDGYLGLRNLGSMPPDAADFPHYHAANLEDDMRRESVAFVRDLIVNNRPAIELVTASHSYLNRDLAKLYGVSDDWPIEDTDRLRRFEFSNRNRGGLLGHASVLTVSANGVETSPVTRGVWVTTHLLGMPPPPPPDDVPAIDPDTRNATTTREQLAAHRADPACAMCHRKIDPWGFALENFDPIGQFRRHYGSKSKTLIDASAILPGGQRTSGVEELKLALADREPFLVRSLTKALLTHALGRRMGPADRVAIDRILARTEASRHGWLDLIAECVADPIFQSP